MECWKEESSFDSVTAREYKPTRKAPNVGSLPFYPWSCRCQSQQVEATLGALPSVQVRMTFCAQATSFDSIVLAHSILSHCALRTWMPRPD
eukprot:2999285-Amphidinium_carterae.1